MTLYLFNSKTDFNNKKCAIVPNKNEATGSPFLLYLSKTKEVKALTNKQFLTIKIGVAYLNTWCCTIVWLANKINKPFSPCTVSGF